MCFEFIIMKESVAHEYREGDAHQKRTADERGDHALRSPGRKVLQDLLTRRKTRAYAVCRIGPDDGQYRH